MRQPAKYSPAESRDGDGSSVINAKLPQAKEGADKPNLRRERSRTNRGPTRRLVGKPSVGMACQPGFIVVSIVRNLRRISH